MGTTLNDINVKYFELVIPSSNRGSKKSQDYSARCPICGDGKNKQSKRFHLYTKASFDDDVIKCFNGDCEYSGNMYSFLRDHHPSLYTSYVQEMKGEKINHIQEFLRQEEPQEIDLLEIDYNIPKVIFDVPNIFVPIIEGSYADEYLDSRKILPEHKKLFLQVIENSIYVDDDKQKDLTGYIIIPLYYGKKLYGFTSRDTSKKEFYTRIPEENTGWKVWNIFNVNKDNEVYIFEAVFDSLSIQNTNVIACLGADLPEDILKDLKKPIFVFDNDITGKKKAKKYAERGHKVLIWGDKTKIKDFNSLLQMGASRKSLQEFLDKNTHAGLSATVRLRLD
jgi:hypothetical protein